MHLDAKTGHDSCIVYACRAAVFVAASPIVRPAETIERLAYTRAQAAEALRVSHSTLKRLLPYIGLVESSRGGPG